jgi:iron complex transport system ATP-binding protein
MQRARLMAVVPQARELPGAFTVYQTVLLGRTPYLGWLGNAGQSDHAAVRRALEQTQATELAERHVGELSGGEQQRVLLARSLAQDAPVMLLDEPTTHLDLQHQSNLLNLVRTLAQEKDLTVLMVLHDLNLASLYADQVALMVAGRVHAFGLPGEVLTSENLTAVYRVPVSVIPHPEYGKPLILPDGLIGSGPKANRAGSFPGGRVHGA